MPKVRICNIGVSIDGFVAGPGQSTAHPLGVGGEAVHAWAFATRSFRKMSGGNGKGDGVDDQIFASGFEGIGAWIIGRNMFGPDRGPWGAQPWRGWWGDNPPFHCPVIVLTHHPRDKLEMDGGTVFHFETGGTRAALTRALKAADGKDVRIGGGASVLRQYLWGGFVDEMHLAMAPTLLGAGERLFEGVDLSARYPCRRVVPGEGATHYFFTRENDAPVRLVT